MLFIAIAIQGFGQWNATKVGEAAAELWRVNAWWVTSDPFAKGLKDLVCGIWPDGRTTVVPCIYQRLSST